MVFFFFFFFSDCSCFLCPIPHSPRTRETLARGHFMSVINILMQLRKVCNHPNLFDPRPIQSPFITKAIIYSTASLVQRALETSPFEVNEDYQQYPKLYYCVLVYIYWSVQSCSWRAVFLLCLYTTGPNTLAWKYLVISGCPKLPPNPYLVLYMVVSETVVDIMECTHSIPQLGLGIEFDAF